VQAPGVADMDGGRAGGVQAFAALVEDLAAAAPQLPLTRLTSRLRSPVRVAVQGRDGVGRATVAGALLRHGVQVARDIAHADVRVLVIAEVLKPEDRVTPTDPPTLIVLNKADLVGSARGGAMETAHRRAAEVRAATGVPTVPLVGLLAEAALAPLDDELVRALRAMVTVPADLSAVDAFVGAEHPVPRAVRERLLARLDRFGVAHAVVALASGADPTDLPALFGVVSNVDAVLAALESVGAPVRYARLLSARSELTSLAVQFDDRRVDALLGSDAAVLSVMTAAVDVVEADGATVDTRDDASAHLARARWWRRYGGGPVNPLHGHCSADIVRGSLRLLDGPS
jgi:hypothetical protein